jgi:hypothetical protein
MRVVFVMKHLCHRCGKMLCGCLLSGGIVFAGLGLGHDMHPAVLPGQGEPPHTENYMDTRQPVEPLKLSAATASTMVFRTTLGPNLRLAGFRSGASSHRMGTEI